MKTKKKLISDYAIENIMKNFEIHFPTPYMHIFKKILDVIKYLDDINKEKMKSLDACIQNRSKKEHLLLYKLE